MAIGKRFTHLNNSGSNHKILDAESAYITGTLQVGPSIPVLGADTNFFVSGIIGGAGGGTPGVGVFGGDLVVSGTIYGLDGVVGGEQYWASEAAGEIFTSASLVNVPSGSVHAQFLSASNGVEVTGSVLFDLTQAPYVSFVISGAEQSFVPYLDIVHNSTNYLTTYSYMTVDPTGSGLVLQNFDGGRQIRLDPYGFGDGEVKITSGSREIYLAANYNGSDIPALWLSPDSSAPTGSIVVEDNNNQPADLDLVIRALKLNGDPGVAGYALTSSGDGAAPGWAPFSTGGAYWDSTTAASIFTTGSVLIRSDDGSGTDSASDYGSDIFFFVSGAIDGVSAGNGVAAFGGDLFVSGNMYVSGTDAIMLFDGQTAQNYLVVDDKNAAKDVKIKAGKIEIRDDYNNVSPGHARLEIDNNSIELVDVGSGFTPILTIQNSTGIPESGRDIIIEAGGVISLSASNGLEVTGSAIFTGGDGVTVGSDTQFFVSGAVYGKDILGQGVAVFGGDLVVSGVMYADNKLQVRDGGQLLLAVDNNIGQASFYVSITGSNGMLLTGALNASPDGTGRGLLKFGGLDIGPITGSASTSTDAILNGNILSASAGVWNGTNPAVLRHEFHILGIGVDTGSGVQTFAATYLVMSAVSAGGVQTALSVTEVSRETSGSFAAAWDVNVANNCAVEVTSSINSGSVEWYAQRVKEMSVNSVGSRT